ncbi:MAG TPA: aldose 1-epimerase family protein [Chloroflexota bacterium]
MVRLFGTELTRREVETRIGRLDQIGGVQPFELTDGRARGVRALRLITGSGLSVTSLIDRALDLAHAEFRGIPLCWRSENGDVAPTYYEPEDDEWLRTHFGGLVTTCGLTNFGPAGSDGYGTFGLHGRVSCLPAAGVRWSEEWQGDECMLEVSGTVAQTRVFGENLHLHRRVRTWLGSSSLWLDDTVANHGSERTPHMILYHWNPGFPILSESSRLYVSHEAMRPRDPEAAKGLEVWDRGGPPQAGFKEQVFVHTPIACADGRAVAALVNRGLLDGQGLGISIHFDPQQLPAFIQWRMLGQGTYVMGLEPANCPTIEGRVEAGRRGTLPFLEPGEQRSYSLELRVLDGSQQIDTVIQQIDDANGR